MGASTLNRSARLSIITGMQVALLRVASASANGARRASSVWPNDLLERRQMITAAPTMMMAATNWIMACSGPTPVLPSCAALMQNRTSGSG